MTRQTQLPFTGKTAVICGGSRGIGQATARRMVELGASVCIIARHPAPLEQTASELRELIRDDSRFVETLACDATNMLELQPLLSTFGDRHGSPDWLINMVGFAHPQYVQELTPEDFRKCMDVNYYGQLNPILCLLPHFMKARRGHIINVSSTMGYFGIMGYAAYAPTKFAIVGLTEVLRHELKPYNIHVSVFYPSDTDTPGFEQENRTKPPECAQMSAGVKLLSAGQAAADLVDGILRDKYVILTRGSGLMWSLNRHIPWLVRWITDIQYKRARG